MGEGFQFIDIILLAMVAGFIALRLRSLLGRRTGEEPEHRPDGSAPHVGQPGVGDDPVAAHMDRESVVRLEANPALRKAFRAMQKVDSYFDVDAFIDGARSVYPMVLEAFWRGDREELRGLLNDDVYEDFNAAITAREEASQTAQGRVLDLADVRIEDAKLVGSVVEITVAYKAEIVLVTMNDRDEVIEGNSSDTVMVNDVWTFERDLKSSDPAWLLVATRSE
ncbi:hypothetical protein JCM17845_22310 [Iodidimonas gelatinilytica]|uniref:Tim44-like domain-containing protein n=1 Tax=Iodidimonas gelatinilytica TaxID=1236966 RepID=A0A5A7N0G8_9PROT|nr:Tim44/TimA family putative adaptor protein [Iodidimonas gelatinilytica]GER01608.1 hypothetical protein JCM17845_22310 [Iodidimonas gelatinilytica]